MSDTPTPPVIAVRQIFITDRGISHPRSVRASPWQLAAERRVGVDSRIMGGPDTVRLAFGNETPAAERWTTRGALTRHPRSAETCFLVPRASNLGPVASLACADNAHAANVINAAGRAGLIESSVSRTQTAASAERPRRRATERERERRGAVTSSTSLVTPRAAGVGHYGSRKVRPEALTTPATVDRYRSTPLGANEVW